jgi:hypothetical protein
MRAPIAAAVPAAWDLVVEVPAVVADVAVAGAVVAGGAGERGQITNTLEH